MRGLPSASHGESVRPASAPARGPLVWDLDHRSHAAPPPALPDIPGQSDHEWQARLWGGSSVPARDGLHGLGRSETTGRSNFLDQLGPDVHLADLCTPAPPPGWGGWPDAAFAGELGDGGTAAGPARRTRQHALGPDGHSCASPHGGVQSDNLLARILGDHWPTSTAAAAPDTTQAGGGGQASSTRTLSNPAVSSDKRSSVTEERRRPLSRGATSGGGQRGGGRRYGRKGGRGGRRARGRGRGRARGTGPAAEALANDGPGVESGQLRPRSWRLSPKGGISTPGQRGEARRGKGPRGGLVGITRQAAAAAVRKEMQELELEESSHGLLSCETQLLAPERGGRGTQGRSTPDRWNRYGFQQVSYQEDERTADREEADLLVPRGRAGLPTASRRRRTLETGRDLERGPAQDGGAGGMGGAMGAQKGHGFSQYLHQADEMPPWDPHGSHRVGSAPAVGRDAAFRGASHLGGMERGRNMGRDHQMELALHGDRNAQVVPDEGLAMDMPRGKGLQRFEPTAGPLVPHSRPRFSNRIIHGDTVYISAQVPDNLGRIGSNTYAGQTINVLSQLDEQLREAGCSKDNLIRVQVFLRDQPYGAQAFYEQWESWVDSTCLPTLMVSQSPHENPGVLIQVEAVASLP
eukprot:jgi/Botrbrau1/9360/Bobra.354_2s0017.1